jgi:hypothetical protein
MHPLFFTLSTTITINAVLEIFLDDFYLFVPVIFAHFWRENRYPWLYEVAKQNGPIRIDSSCS